MNITKRFWRVLFQPFDPTKHEAVSTVPAPSPELDGHVVGVVP